MQIWFDELIRRKPVDWRVKFAELANIATSAADTGCSFSKGLVVNSAKDLFHTIGCAIRRTKLLSEMPPEAKLEDFPILFKGGQLENSLLYCSTLVELLREYHVEMPLVFTEFGPFFGITGRAEDRE